ncbi:AbrB/MazE/SpoVT family DNA-binding domain-containing protein [Microbacterium sp. 18062]|uniref:AbrB/MazE/SpoVT family DNA-binding domain-containing protein n=1 Tax=Microbacterium sp. 18062 TaxID=2681410 RepID=UPI00135C3ED9|nr:AbrB/MazE/SpoVT family DNA-binding domain-containing protein [Microbacterium sp. 18062]
MKTTIDTGGRVVIPKELREALGLSAGQTVDVGILDGRISIDVTGTGMHLEVRDGLPTAVPDRPIEPLTSQTVRATLEQLRR